MHDIAKAALRLACGLVVLVGVPAALIITVGWPLPRSIPSLAQIGSAFDRHGVPVDVVINTLAVIVWVAWAQLVWAVAAETAAAIRGRQARRTPVLPSLQTFAGELVASATLIVSMLGPLRSTAAASTAPVPLAPLEISDTPPLVAARPDSRQAPRADTGQHIVVHGDSYWGLAHTYLGHGSRWREIRDANIGRAVAAGHIITALDDDLRPGWTIHLPAKAAHAPAQHPAAADPSSPPAPGEVMVKSGDSMWSVAEHQLASDLGRTPSDTEVATYWRSLIDANRTRIRSGDPDLIYPGETLAVPPTPSAGPRSDHSRSAAPSPASPAASPPIAAEPPPATQSPLPASPAGPQDQAEVEAPETTAAPRESPANIDALPNGGESEQDPSTTDVAAREHETDASLPLAQLGIAGSASVALAVGVTRAIRKRRRRIHHLPDATAAPPTPTSTGDQDIHRGLLVAADEHALDTLSAALDDLAHRIGAAGLGCRPRIVQHGDDHLDVLLDQPTLPAVDGWQPQADGAVWTLDTNAAATTDTLPAGDHGDGTTATPLLVSLGQPDTGGQLYIDLEAERLVALTGNAEATIGLARTLAAELAHSPFAATAQIMVIGNLGPSQLDDLDRLTVLDSWDDVAADLAAWADQSRDALTANGWPNPYTARGQHADHDALTPVVVIATQPPHNPETLGTLHEGAPAVAVVTVGEPPRGATVIDCQPDQLTLPQLGLVCQPQVLGPDEIDSIVDLVEHAATSPDGQLALAIDHELAGDADAPVTNEPYRDPPHEILVRFLGDIAVHGGARSLTGQQTALVAYIALHGNVGADRVIDGVWAGPTPVSPRKRLANTISKCRAAIGARHLPVAKDGRYRAGPDVATDLDLFDRRITAAAHQPPDVAADTLQGALDLVDGPIFTYPSTDRDSYTWVDVENWVSTWEPKITAVADRVAQLHLDRHQPERAAQLAERILRAVPTHTGLTETLMRAHAAKGDRLAVQRVYQAHAAALDQLDLDTVAPSTAELYEHLRAASS
jgi:nucleoid-associated protein YgaU/DNA-binding SARP family transcriptional activator